MAEEQKIRLRIFLEVMGWPEEKLKEHLKKVMELLKKKLKWEIVKEDFAEPDKISEKMYTCHVEFEGIAPSLKDVFLFGMLYGPSAIEILGPLEFYFTAGDIQDILADMISKVQGMDKEIKVLAAQNKKSIDILTTLEKKGILKKQASNAEKDQE